VAAHLHRKATSHDARAAEAAFGIPQRSAFEPAVGVQEEQDIARGMSCTKVHLAGAAARALQEKISGRGQPAGGVVAAAIHDDDLARLVLAQQ